MALATRLARLLLPPANEAIAQREHGRLALRKCNTKTNTFEPQRRRERRENAEGKYESPSHGEASHSTPRKGRERKGVGIEFMG